MKDEIVINDDGSVTIRQKVLKIPNIDLLEVIGTGASGIVIKGKNQFLERIVAVKLWLQMKPSDTRDKFLQGISEAKKTEMARGSNVIHIHDAGEVSGHFYISMEYFSGITLKKWLKIHSPKMAVRWHFAEQLVESVCTTTDEDTYHGDLHSKNILVGASVAPPKERPNREFAPHFVIIDFGTSRFSSKDHSIARHWNVFHQTLAELLYPFDIRKIWGHEKPSSDDPDSIWSWYESFLKEIPHMIHSLGISWVVNLLEPNRTYSKEIEDMLKEFVDKRQLSLNVSELGNFKEWWI